MRGTFGYMQAGDTMRARIARKSVGGKCPRLLFRFKEASKKKASTLVCDGWAADLPEGWIQKIYKRESGASKGRKDKYWISPVESIKLKSWVQVKKFLCALKIEGDEHDANELRKKGNKKRKKNHNYHHNI
jgi:hypothetical protein